MWRLPCLISIESTMKWLPQHVDRSMWKTILCQVTTPMTRPSREFTRSRTIWDQPPAWQPKSRTTAFLVGFGSLHSAICWGWFYFWKLNGFCEFATKKTHKSSQVLLSYEILSLFFWHLFVARISAFHCCKVGLVRMENRTSSCFSLNAARDLWHCSGTLHEEKHNVQYKKS